MTKHSKNNSMFNFDMFKTRKFKCGTIATIITVLFVTIIIGINMVVKVCDDKFNWSIDLTKNKIFRITDESKNYIKNLDKDVEIIVLATEDEFKGGNEYLTQANTVIKQYAQESDKISLEYVSLTDNPTFASKYSQDDLQTNSIIVQSGDNHVVLLPSDLFNIESYYYTSKITASNAEQSMTSAIINVTSDEKVKISFIQGFDEGEYSSLKDLLEKNNYDVSLVSLLTEDIDVNSKVVVIYGPRRDLDNVAIQKLNAYMESDGGKGKNLLYFVSPDKESTPKLDSFLETWQIKVGDGIVFDTNMRNLPVINNPYFAVNEYINSTYTEGIKSIAIPVALGYSRPLEVMDEDMVDVLLSFSESSGIRPSTAENGWTPSDSDLVGNIPSMVVSNRYNDNSSVSHFAVAGTTIGFDSDALSRTSLNNSAYILNVFRIFSERESTVNIEPKSLAGEELGINSMQAIYLGVIFTVIIPLFVFIIGVVVCVRRKNR